jgi:hypothetical protein
LSWQLHVGLERAQALVLGLEVVEVAVDVELRPLCELGGSVSNPTRQIIDPLVPSLGVDPPHAPKDERIRRYRTYKQPGTLAVTDVVHAEEQ